MERKRSLAFHTALYAIANIGSRLLGFLMLPIYTRKLTPGDYGDFEILSMATVTVSIILQAGLGAAIVRLYHDRADDLGKRKVVGTAMIFTAVVFTIFLPFALGFADQLGPLFVERHDATKLFTLVMISLYFDNLNTAAGTFFMTGERSDITVMLSLGRVFLAFSLNIVAVVVLDRGLPGILEASVVTSVASFLATNGYYLSKNRLAFSTTDLKALLRFGLPFVPGALAYFVIHQGDRYFLRIFAGSAEIGRYGLAYRLGMMVTYLLGEPFHAIWQTRGIALFKSNEHGAIADSFRRYFLMLLWIWLGIALLSQDVLEVMVGVEFRGVHDIVAVIALGYVFRSVADFFCTPLSYAHKPKLISLVVSVSAVFIVILYWLLIPRLGGMGAALATLGAFTFMTLISLFLGEREQHVPYPWGKVAFYTGAAALFFGAGRALPMDPSPLRFVILLLLAILFPIAIAPDTARQGFAQAKATVLKKLGRTTDAAAPRSP